MRTVTNNKGEKLEVSPLSYKIMKKAFRNGETETVITSAKLVAGELVKSTETIILSENFK